MRYGYLLAPLKRSRLIITDGSLSLPPLMTAGALRPIEQAIVRNWACSIALWVNYTTLSSPHCI